MTRRTLFQTGAAAASLALGASASQQGNGKGRLKQGVAQWCFKKMTLEDLCKESARIGIKGIDLVGPADWPTVKKYGLVPSMVPAGHSIGDGINRKENHDGIEKIMRDNIEKAAAGGAPNVITLSGNRKGMSDEEGADNCVLFLNRVKKFAEDKGITICLELLNAKDHKDYMCDHTAWGVNVCKRVGSSRVKLLYDIYHMQRMEGEIIRTIRENIQYIGHFHTGGNPGRNEIDETQELNYRAISEAIAALNFDGFVSHEFIPKRDPVKSLEQAFAICNV
jgi:hydroxypyruvate isomerase